MNMKNIVILTTSLIVGILLVTSVLIPIIDVGVKPRTTFDNGNSGYSQLNALEDGETATVTRSATDPTLWYVNGTEVHTFNSSIIVATDSFAFQVSSEGNLPTSAGNLFFSTTTSSIALPSEGEISFTFDGGQATYTYGTDPTTASFDYTYAYVLAPMGKGQYTNVNTNTSDVYVHNYDEIMFINQYSWCVFGDNVAVGITSPISFSGGVIQDKYEDLIKFDNNNRLNLNTTSASNPINAYVVPTKVTSYYVEDAGITGSILVMIPIFVLIGMIVAIFRTKMRT